MDNWISVKDRLPENRERVIVFFINEYDKKWQTIAEYVSEKSILAEDYLDSEYSDFSEYDEEKDCFWTPSGFYEHQYFTDINYFITDKVTHWKPLSPPPKGEINEK